MASLMFLSLLIVFIFAPACNSENVASNKSDGDGTPQFENDGDAEAESGADMDSDDPLAIVDGDKDKAGDGDADAVEAENGEIDTVQADGDTEPDAEHNPDDLPFGAADPENAPDPAVAGPFPVGVKTIDFFDEERAGILGNDPRFLRTEIWYPAVQSAASGPFVSYDVRVEGVDPNIDLGEKAEELQNTDIGLFVSQAVRDADMDRRYGPYPVIIFSHGAYSARFQYNFYTVHLASHGYIVIAPDHEGNTLWDMVRDGFSFVKMASSAGDRITDMKFMLYKAEELNADESGFFGGMIDTERAALSGHSFGGFTSVVAHYRYPQSFDLTVALAPVLNTYFLQMNSCQLANCEGPAMIIGGTLDKTITFKEQYCGYSALASDEKYLVKVENGAHFTFSDMCTINLENMPTSEGAPDIASDGCAIENIPYEQGWRIARHYATAFLNFRQRNSPDSQAYLVQYSDSPFDVTTFYRGNDLPAWPGGCGK